MNSHFFSEKCAVGIRILLEVWIGVEDNQNLLSWTGKRMKKSGHKALIEKIEKEATWPDSCSFLAIPPYK